MTNTNIVFYKELTSGWKRGEANDTRTEEEEEEATPETIRQGTVRMEEHPDYEGALQSATDAGFEVRISGEASIEWTELYDIKSSFALSRF
jgi:hypothetical protein